MLYPSDAEAMEMYRRKTDLLERQTVTTLCGNTIAATLVTVLCWSIVNSAALAFWLGLIIVTLAMRLRKVIGFKRHAQPSQLNDCFAYCARSVTLNGCLWALLFAYLAFKLEPNTLVYPFMALCAISAGTCLLYNAHFNPFRNYAVPALLLPSLVLVMTAEPIKMWMGLIVFCWFLLMYSISTQLQRYLAGASRYETENIALLRDLEFQKEKTERLNEELQLKSEIIHKLAKTQQASMQPQKPEPALDANQQQIKVAEN